jgi:hypothetical protein
VLPVLVSPPREAHPESEGQMPSALHAKDAATGSTRAAH